MMVASASAHWSECRPHCPLTRHQDGGWAARIEEKQEEAIDRKSAITEKARRAAELPKIFVCVVLFEDPCLSKFAIKSDEPFDVSG